MASHSESTLRNFCEAGIWLNDRKAYWYDSIDDAIAAYRNAKPN